MLVLMRPGGTKKTIHKRKRRRFGQVGDGFPHRDGGQMQKRHAVAPAHQAPRRRSAPSLRRLQSRSLLRSAPSISLRDHSRHDPRALNHLPLLGLPWSFYCYGFPRQQRRRQQHIQQYKQAHTAAAHTAHTAAAAAHTAAAARRSS